MTTDYLARRLIIQEHVEKNRDRLIELWEQLAFEIISIIGEEGFISLYKRSEFLAHQNFAWLSTQSQTDQINQWLLKLQACFESQPSPEAYNANLMLLNIFTDILALLIGEQLTLRILNSAWDINSLTASNSEHKNE